MFFRFTRGGAYPPAFYGVTLAVTLLCAIEPMLLRTLSEMEARAGADGPSALRILVRPIAYAFGILLFTVFDQNNTQFIYSRF